jgi:acyl phosphate:glycerol-3-phosphate acyltransferase
LEGWVVAACVAAGSYLLGSVPFGIIVARWWGLADPRSVGSGNIGATNLLRTGGRWPGALTLLLDGGKGAAAVLAGAAMLRDGGPLAAVGVFFGHLYPIWLRFRGGKGVATLLGLALALYWPAGLIALLAWLLAMAGSRISSVGGMSAAVVLPIAAPLLGRGDLTLLFLALAIVVVWRHRGNIARLRQGTEPRIGRRAAD